MKARITGDEEQGESLLPGNTKGMEPMGRLSKQNAGWQWLTMICTVIASLALGYFTGAGSVKLPVTHQGGLLTPPGTVEMKWTHNHTFTQKPNAESEAAWASLIPEGRGFVHHEEVAPFISNIVVFHELHCLHAIIVAYYKALESPAITNIDDIPDRESSTSASIKVKHVRHCFDYIRQALMCAADTNLEVVDQKTHATSGWHQPKKCRDYDQIFQWAEKYANSTDTGIVALKTTINP